MNQNILNTWFDNQINVFGFDNGFTVNNNLITFNRYNFTGIFVNEVFSPCFQHTGSQFTTDNLFQIGLIHLDVFSQVKNLKNILVILETNSSQQCGDRQFLLTVNVGVHHIVDVCSKLNPWAFERNNTGWIEFCTISMDTLSKEYTRRTVKLWNNNSLCTINYECSFRSHVRNRTQIYVLDDSVKIFVIGVCTIKL